MSYYLNEKYIKYETSPSRDFTYEIKGGIATIATNLIIKTHGVQLL